MTSGFRTLNHGCSTKWEQEYCSFHGALFWNIILFQIIKIKENENVDWYESQFFYFIGSGRHATHFGPSCGDVKFIIREVILLYCISSWLNGYQRTECFHFRTNKIQRITFQPNVHGSSHERLLHMMFGFWRVSEVAHPTKVFL